jgi:uncharacterized membrane protein
MPRFCASCGAAMAEGAFTCAACGKAAAQSTGAGAAVAPAPTASAGGLTDNVAGLLAYVTIIPAIVFLVMEPYNRNRFVRFHSFQSIFFCVACIALGIVLSVVSAIPFVALLGLFIWPIVALAELAVWVVLLLKAYQGQKFKLPVIGDMAEKQANA